MLRAHTRCIYWGRCWKKWGLLLVLYSFICFCFIVLSLSNSYRYKRREKNPKRSSNKCYFPSTARGRRGWNRIVEWIYNLQSVSITTKVVSSNPFYGEMYSIQHYVIKFVSDLRQVCGFLQVLRFPPPIKLTATI